METKQLKITVPEGYEIDKEKSTFENIVFKEKTALNHVTYLGFDREECRINNRWAFSVFECENEGERYKGGILSGHGATLFLCAETWIDENGNPIEGYLYYKSK
jgi:hypothetical protein